jgi:hypothetical protein
MPKQDYKQTKFMRTAKTGAATLSLPFRQLLNGSQESLPLEQLSRIRIEDSVFYESHSEGRVALGFFLS